MRYIFLPSTIIFFVLSSIALVGAQTHGDISSKITLRENNITSIESQFTIKNQSTQELISEIKLLLPYEEYKVKSVKGVDSYYTDDNTLTLKFFKNPIDIGQNRVVKINIQAVGIINEWGDFKRIILSKFTGDFSVDSYSTSVNYPTSWGEPTYSSREYNLISGSSIRINQNKAYYLVWGEQASENFDFRLKIDSMANNILIPIIKESYNQETEFNNISNVKNVFFDEDENTYLMLEEAGEMAISGTVKYSSKVNQAYVEDTYQKPIIEMADLGVGDLSSTDKVKRVGQEVKRVFRFTSEKSLDESISSLSGNQWNLAFTTANWLRSEGIPCFIEIGWDRSLEGKASDLRYWISYYDGGEWKSLDISAYISGKTDKLDAAVPERITLLTFSNFNKKEYEKFSRFTSKDLFPGLLVTDNDIQEGNDIKISFLWDEESSNSRKMVGKLNLENDTPKVVRIDRIEFNNSEYLLSKIKDMKTGVLPMAIEQIEIEYSKSLFDLEEVVNYEIFYLLDSELFSSKGSRVMTVGVGEIAGSILVETAILTFGILLLIVTSQYIYGVGYKTSYKAQRLIKTIRPSRPKR